MCGQHPVFLPPPDCSTEELGPSGCKPELAGARDDPKSVIRDFVVIVMIKI